MTANNEDTIITGEVNAKGEAALTAWLRDNLPEADGLHAEAWAADMVANIDGSFAADIGMMVELRGLNSRTGNPATYSFGAGEYDLVTYNEDGDVIAREVA